VPASPLAERITFPVWEAESASAAKRLISERAEEPGVPLGDLPGFGEDEEDTEKAEMSSRVLGELIRLAATSARQGLDIGKLRAASAAEVST
jgi:hypothetical protein